MENVIKEEDGWIVSEDSLQETGVTIKVEVNDEENDLYTACWEGTEQTATLPDNDVEAGAANAPEDETANQQIVIVPEGAPSISEDVTNSAVLDYSGGNQEYTEQDVPHQGFGRPLNGIVVFAAAGGSAAYDGDIPVIENEGTVPVSRELYQQRDGSEAQEGLPSVERPFRCTYCTKTFTRAGNLTNHIRTHTGERPFVCKYCQKTFLRSEQLKYHERIHTGVRPYQCEFCEKGFIKPGQLKEHRRVHTGERPYSCKYCGLTFTRAFDLTVHERIHSGVKPYQCQYCHKAFAQAGVLKRHEKVHTGEKTHQCRYCVKSFIQAGELVVHERVHTGDRPHQCSHCGKRFAQSGNLREHERVHSGVRPYLCSFCMRAFKSSAELRRHLATHTGVRPFPCAYCDKAFALPRDQKRHQRIHTRGKISKRSAIVPLESDPNSGQSEVDDSNVALQGTEVNSRAMTDPGINMGEAATGMSSEGVIKTPQLETVNSININIDGESMSGGNSQGIFRSIPVDSGWSGEGITYTQLQDTAGEPRVTPDSSVDIVEDVVNGEISQESLEIEPLDSPAKSLHYEMDNQITEVQDEDVVSQESFNIVKETTSVVIPQGGIVDKVLDSGVSLGGPFEDDRCTVADLHGIGDNELQSQERSTPVSVLLG